MGEPRAGLCVTGRKTRLQMMGGYHAWSWAGRVSWAGVDLEVRARAACHAKSLCPALTVSIQMSSIVC